MNEFAVHNVSKIQVSANSAPVIGGDRTAYWQILTLMNDKDQELGRVVLYLTDPLAALPLGDQPPYWGMDLTKPAQMMDGEAPF